MPLILAGLLLAASPAGSDFVFPGAAALVVREVVRVDIGRDFRLTEYRDLEYRLFNTLGREKYGEIFQNYNQRFDTLKIIKARTVLADGAVLEPESAAISDLSAAESALAPAYRAIRTRVVTYPGLAPGATVQYESQKTTAAVSLDRTISAIIPFARADPVGHKEFSLKIPNDALIAYRASPGIKAETGKDGDFTAFRWTIDSAAAVAAEPFMVDPASLGPRVVLTNFADWKAVGRWLYKKMRDMIRYNAEMIALVSEFESQIKTTSPYVLKYTTISDIFNLVATQWRDVPIAMKDQGYRPLAYTHEIFKNRYGTPLDRCALLVTLLGIPGYTPYPAFVARSDCRDSLPMPDYFDAVIVAVPDFDSFIFLDPRPPAQPAGEPVPGPVPGLREAVQVTGFTPGAGLTAGLAGRPVAIATPDSMIFTRIPEFNGPVSDLEFSVEIRADGSIVAGLRAVLNGFAAARCREYFHGVAEKDRLAAIETMLRAVRNNARVLAGKVENLDRLLSPVVLTVEFECPGYVTRQANSLEFEILQPLFSFFELDAVFGLKERRYPFTVAESRALEYRLDLSYPPEWKIAYVPESLSIGNATGAAQSRFESRDRALSISRSFKFSRADFRADDYPDLLALYRAFTAPAQSKILFTPH